MTVIAIVGGGLSGTVLALNLMDRARAHDHVILIERRKEVGLGQAYSTKEPSHLLNIRASEMSPFTQQPETFVDFLRGHLDLLPDDASVQDCYAPRFLYGKYLCDLVQTKLRAHKGLTTMTFIQGNAVDISSKESGGIILDDGQSIEADRVVLALGNAPPSTPTLIKGRYETSSFYIGDPWSSNAFADVAADDHVFLLGTGLTMVDSVLSLIAKGHNGQITAASRHGLLPRGHQPVKEWPSFLNPKKPYAVAEILRLVRHEVEKAHGMGQPWQAVLNSFRPFIQDIWVGFTPAEQARFLRHLRAYWDVHRHRLAPSVSATLQRLRDAGQLNIIAGRVLHLQQVDNTLELVLKRRSCPSSETFHVNKFANCSGPNYDFASSGEVLLQQLFNRGLVSLNAHKLGIQVTAAFETIGADGTINPNLMAMGPMLRGQYWEINAVPEIAAQAKAMSEQLLPA